MTKEMERGLERELGDVSRIDRLIRQLGFFFGMVLILAVLVLILVWEFIQAILLVILIVGSDLSGCLPV